VYFLKDQGGEDWRKKGGNACTKFGNGRRWSLGKWGPREFPSGGDRGGKGTPKEGNAFGKCGGGLSREKRTDRGTSLSEEVRGPGEEKSPTKRKERGGKDLDVDKRLNERAAWREGNSQGESRRFLGAGGERKKLNGGLRKGGRISDRTGGGELGGGEGEPPRKGQLQEISKKSERAGKKVGGAGIRNEGGAVIKDVLVQKRGWGESCGEGGGRK